MNKQRETIYALRREVLGNENLQELVVEYAEDVAAEMLEAATGGSRNRAEWDFDSLALGLLRSFGLVVDFSPGSVLAQIDAAEKAVGRVTGAGAEELCRQRS